MNPLEVTAKPNSGRDSENQVTEQKGKKDFKEPVDFTEHFLPLKDWFALEHETFERWMTISDTKGKCNLEKTLLSIGLTTLVGINILQWRELNRRMLKAFQEQVGIITRYDPALSFPKRTESSYGYSWPAWRKAATYAGRKEPPGSISAILDAARKALDYHVSILRNWQSDFQLFALDLNDLLDNGGPVTEIDDITYKTASITRISNRLSHFYQAAILWRNIIACLESLLKCGINFRGRQAFLNLPSSPKVQQLHSLLFRSIQYLGYRQALNLRDTFFEGRGKDYVRKVMVPHKPLEKRNLLELLIGIPPVDYDLVVSLEKLHKQNYLDFTIVCMLGPGEDHHVEDHDHQILAYEQAINDDPESAKGLPRIIQQVIGEMTMTQDVGGTYQDLSYGTNSGPKGYHGIPPKHVYGRVHMFEKWYGLARTVFDEPFPDFQKLYKNGKITEDGCEMLWEHWNSTASRLFDRPLNQLFAIEDLMAPTAPQWQPEVKPEDIPSPTEEDEINDLSQDEISIPLSQSGHSYYRLRHSESMKSKPIGFTVDEDDNNTFEVPKVALKSIENAEKAPVFQSTSQQYFTVTRKQLKLAEKLFSDPSDESAQGQVKWVDIYNLMRRIGFSIDHVGGSLIRFTPPNNAGLPFTEHRPHPETTLSAIRYRAFGKRLTEKYGWDRTWFVKCSLVGEKRVLDDIQ